MPVIGRLDGQVDEVLIKPVSRGRRDGEEEAPAAEDDKAAPAPAPPAETRTPRAGARVALRGARAGASGGPGVGVSSALSPWGRVGRRGASPMGEGR